MLDRSVEECLVHGDQVWSFLQLSHSRRELGSVRDPFCDIHMQILKLRIALQEFALGRRPQLLRALVAECTAR